MSFDVDSFNDKLQDLDTVVISKFNDITPGVYYNRRVLTLHGKVNVSQIDGIMKTSSKNKIFQSTIKEIKEKYADEFTSKTKELVINQLDVGQVLVTKTNKKWLYLGNFWSMHNHCEKKLRSGALFISMEHIYTNKSLTENINSIIEKCSNTKDMLKYFKFSQPKAIAIDKSYSVKEEDIDEFLKTGYIGIVHDKNSYCLLMHYDSYTYIIEESEKDIFIQRCCGSIGRVELYSNSLKRTIKVDKFNDDELK